MGARILVHSLNVVIHSSLSRSYKDILFKEMIND